MFHNHAQQRKLDKRTCQTVFSFDIIFFHLCYLVEPQTVNLLRKYVSSWQQRFFAWDAPRGVWRYRLYNIDESGALNAFPFDADASDDGAACSSSSGSGSSISSRAGSGTANKDWSAPARVPLIIYERYFVVVDAAAIDSFAPLASPSSSSTSSSSTSLSLSSVASTSASSSSSASSLTSLLRASPAARLALLNLIGSVWRVHALRPVSTYQSYDVCRPSQLRGQWCVCNRNVVRTNTTNAAAPPV
jgi:hypothetical protein